MDYYEKQRLLKSILKGSKDADNFRIAGYFYAQPTNKGTCVLCGRGISDVYLIKNDDDVQIELGSECVKTWSDHLGFPRGAENIPKKKRRKILKKDDFMWNFDQEDLPF